jgi:hypothetical protein
MYLCNFIHLIWNYFLSLQGLPSSWEHTAHYLDHGIAVVLLSLSVKMIRLNAWSDVTFCLWCSWGLYVRACVCACVLVLQALVTGQIDLKVIYWLQKTLWAIKYTLGSMRGCSWLSHCATSRKVADSIPDGVSGICHWLPPSGRTIALTTPQPLTEMSTGNTSWGKGDRFIWLKTKESSRVCTAELHIMCIIQEVSLYSSVL